jgi:hypothetical protein
MAGDVHLWYQRMDNIKPSLDDMLASMNELGLAQVLRG